MFLKFYNLADQPFGVTPDPQRLYLGATHREALASLLYGTETDRGFLALIAPPGMGKTTLLYKYLEGLRDKARTAYVFQTHCDSRELLRHILTDLGLDVSGKDLPAIHEMLNRLLLEEWHAGRRFILVIDEAQNLDEKALEAVRLLSNFETPSRKLMQIVLAGQPQLAEKLSRPAMTQLRQRLSIVIRIEQFSAKETSVYIDHRLRFAGYQGPSLFTAGARLLIAEQSEGIPRNINNICFSAMSLGCALKRKIIDRDVVLAVLKDLDLLSLAHANSLVDSTEEPQQNLSQTVSPKPRLRFRAWVPRVAAVAALVSAVTVSGLGITRSHPAKRSFRSAPVQESIAIQADQISLTPTPVVHSGDTPPGQRQLHGIQVVAGETLYSISTTQLGKYDKEVLRELRAVNPWLTNPDYLQAGQTVLMPSNSQLATPRRSRTEAGSDLVPAKENKR